MKRLIYILLVILSGCVNIKEGQIFYLGVYPLVVIDNNRYLCYGSIGTFEKKGNKLILNSDYYDSIIISKIQYSHFANNEFSCLGVVHNDGSNVFACSVNLFNITKRDTITKIDIIGNQLTCINNIYKYDSCQVFFRGNICNIMSNKVLIRKADTINIIIDYPPLGSQYKFFKNEKFRIKKGKLYQ